MEIIKKYRYPGINSFESSDSDIFFGREDDRKTLADLIEIEKTVLLYSRSGLGKSSLIKAALIPELQLRGFSCFYLRLGLFFEGNVTPVQNILMRVNLSNTSALPDTFLKKFINRTSSLWFTFKTLQISRSSDAPVLLSFDQFEEFASYPPAQILEFKQQLAELLNPSVPKSYMDALKYPELLTEPLTEEELDTLYRPLKIRILFSVRSDQISLLNQLSDYLPNILKVFYELKPLNRQQALHAIVDPAMKEGAFISPPFSYSRDALDKLVNALSFGGTNQIDTSQLQIVLQYIEQDIVEKKNVLNLNGDSLGDLNKVYENYYRNSILKLDEQQKEAEELIEDKLIADKRRISYDKALCLQMVSQAVLDKLEETRLLRKEPNTTGGYSYELAHDTLVAPVLEARQKRLIREEETKQKTDFENKLKEQEAHAKRKRTSILIIMMVFILFLFGAATVFQINQVSIKKRQIKAFKLSIESENIVSENPTLAINLAYEAVKLHPDSFIVDKAFSIMQKFRFYKNVVKVSSKSFIALSPNCDRIITSSPFGEDSVWDMNGKLLNAFVEPSKLRSVDFSKDGTMLMGSENGEVSLRSPQGALIRMLRNVGSKVTTSLFSPDEKNIIVRSEKDYKITVMNLNGDSLTSFDDGNIVCAIFSPDGSKILTGSEDGITRLFTLNGHLIGQSPRSWRGTIMSVAFINDSTMLSGSWDGMLSTDSFSRGTSNSNLKNTMPQLFKIDEACFNNDPVSTIGSFYPKESEFVYTGTWDLGLINCWDKNTKNAQGGFKKVAELKGHTGVIHNMAYDSKNDLLYSCSNDGTAKKWTSKSIYSNYKHPSERSSVNHANKIFEQDAEPQEFISRADETKAFKDFMNSQKVEPLTRAEINQYLK